MLAEGEVHGAVILSEITFDGLREFTFVFVFFFIVAVQSKFIFLSGI